MSKLLFRFIVLVQLFVQILVFRLPCAEAQSSKSNGKKDIIAAGVPKWLGEKRDYEPMFAQLANAKINVYMPFSIFQEIPAAKSLENEGDFLKLPLSAKARQALLKYNLKLLIPAEIVYGESVALPELRNDPLRLLIAAWGRSNVYGVYSYDEPALRSLDHSKARSLYLRIKEIDKTLPVLMVHGPIPEERKTRTAVADYLRAVETYNDCADVIGFDIYPIPPDLAKIPCPSLSPGEHSKDFLYTLKDYMNWLNRHVPKKAHLLCIQAFSYEDQGFDPLTAAWYGARKPSRKEIEQMAQFTFDSGSCLVLYGQSYLKKQSDIQFWNELLDVCRNLRH